MQLTFVLFFLILIYSILITLSFLHAQGDECVYTLYVKTASIIKSGTDSKISLSLGDPQGRFVWVTDLQSWGLMGPSYDYYELCNLDIFSGTGPCIGTPICRLNLTSDGSGSYHGWYCDYVKVTFTGPHKGCSQTIFYVDQWLATDAPPFKLTAQLDGCSLWDESANKKQRFVVGNQRRNAAA